MKRIPGRCHSDHLYLAATVLCAAFLVDTGFACTVPVYRYALEYWQPDNYVLVLFYRDSLTAKDTAQLNRFVDPHSGRPVLNLRVYPVNVSGESADGLTDSLRQRYADKQLPYMVLCLPGWGSIGKPVWSAPLSPAGVEAIRTSPAREKIAGHIVDGALCVWVMVAGGNAARNAAARDTLGAAIEELEEHILFPRLAPEDAAGLRGGYVPPEKARSAVVSIDPYDPAEIVLLSILREMRPPAAPDSGALIVPVFGRGRMLDVFVGDGISRSALVRTGWFLAGPCACTVKYQNPGFDLVFAVDWVAGLGAEAPATPMRPLQGLSGFTDSAGDGAADSMGARR